MEGLKVAFVTLYKDLNLLDGKASGSPSKNCSITNTQATTTQDEPHGFVGTTGKGDKVQ
jgi:hypothetical protein